MTTVFKHLLNPRDLREHYAAALLDCRFERYCAGQSDSARWSDRFTAAWFVFVTRYHAAVCDLRGHDYDTNGCDYPQDGGEGFTCARCGYSFTAWH